MISRSPFARSVVRGRGQSRHAARGGRGPGHPLAAPCLPTYERRPPIFRRRRRKAYNICSWQISMRAHSIVGCGRGGSAPASCDGVRTCLNGRDYVRARLASLRLSPTREAEIVEELSQHLDDRYQELIAGGASPDEARRVALGDFRSSGALARHLAPLRQARTPPPITPGATSGHVLGDLWQDVRYAVRMFARQRGFAAAAILTLALGIGANSTIFTVVRAVLMGALPFRDADRLYRLPHDLSGRKRLRDVLRARLHEPARVDARVRSLGAYTSGTVTMLGGGEPQRGARHERQRRAVRSARPARRRRARLHRG